ncbi:MAG: ATP synthase gamma chain, sodium ion specific [Verrucomicrobia bacterium ADurb.Bin118]|jgi:F-type H+-transporting ATPase subunit gamma|nr:ATP synthase F1 subunit gamma [Verrucomicrobiota bacterium]OQB88759.1 MAG: ATP synthase gamma chain, sodium ion specific [Verrucomicrobia bacterium ADurb.Bin118]
MASSRDIRRRIKSVKSTAQITKAMQMVAASKMRKAQQAALAGRPYTTTMNRMLAELLPATGDFSHPLMERRPGGSRCVILVSTDKGLCGALNSTLFREAAKFDKDTTVFISAGRKAGQFLARARRSLLAEFSYKDAPLFSEARAISKFVQEGFLKGEYHQVDVLFTNFVSTLTQRPEVISLLPLHEISAVQAAPGGEKPGLALLKGATEFLFEPSTHEVLGALLPHYLNYRLYQVLLEAKASEHSARMVAMKNATENANQLVKDLTLQYNKMRQASITKELLEIATAQMALA